MYVGKGSKGEPIQIDMKNKASKEMMLGTIESNFEDVVLFSNQIQLEYIHIGFAALFLNSHCKRRNDNEVLIVESSKTFALVI